MKMEDHFKDTLNKAVANEPPVQDAWNRFEHRVRRGRWVRWSAGVATVAVVAVAAVIAIPKIARDNRVIVPPATQPPSSSPSVDPYAGWVHAASDTMLYDARFPSFGPFGQNPRDDWGTSSFEGVDAFQPLAVEPLEKGNPTFAVTLRFDQGADPSKPPAGEWNTSGAPGTAADNRKEYVFESDNGGRHEIVYQIEWSACAAGETPCRQVDGTLVVRMLGETAALYDKYSGTGELIVESIRHIEPGARESQFGGNGTPSPSP